MQFKPFFVMILLVRAGLCLLHGSIGYVGSGGGVAQSDSFRSYGVIGQSMGQVFVSNDSVVHLGGYIPRIHPPDTNPLASDLDGDGLPLGWENTYGLNEFSNDASVDADTDGLSNLAEYQAQTSPTRADTDADGLTDQQELNVYQTNPLIADGDGDGYSDGEEVAQGTDPNDSSDNPGVITASVLQNPFRRLNSAGARSAGGGLDNFQGVGVGLGAGLAYNGNIQTHSPMAWVAHPFEQNPRSIDTDTDGMPDYWEKL